MIIIVKRHWHRVDSKHVDVLRQTSKNDRQLDYVDSKGMRVVVGRYVGSDLSSNKPDLSDAEINDNRYDPRPGDGEDGQPVFLGAREDRVGKKLWHINKFNIMGKLFTIFTNIGDDICK
jgi:hypothetical protein